MSRKNYTNLYWQSKKVSQGPLGFFLRLSWTKVQHTIWFLVGLYFSVKNHFVCKHWKPSATAKDSQVGFSIYAPSFEFNPECCLKIITLTVFYSGSMVLFFLCFNSCSIEGIRKIRALADTHPQVHSHTHKDPTQILPFSFKLWLFLSFGTFYHQTCPRRSSFLTRAKK